MADMTRDELKELRARVIDPIAWRMRDSGRPDVLWQSDVARSIKIAEATMKAEADAGMAVVSTEIHALTKMALTAIKEHEDMVERGDADKGEPDWANSICVAIDEHNILEE